jgi:hypothetical protein
MEHGETIQKAAEKIAFSALNAVDELRKVAGDARREVAGIRTAAEQSKAEMTVVIAKSAETAKRAIEERLFWGAAVIFVAFVLSLGVVYLGARWTYKAVAAEREELRHDLLEIQREIAEREKVLEQMKTFGISIGRDVKAGEQWIKLPIGLKFGTQGKFGDGTDGIFFLKK